MSPVERRAALARWEAMSPERRQRILERWRRFRALPAAERARLRARWSWWKRLEPVERKFLLDRLAAYESLSPGDRAGFDRFAERFSRLPSARRRKAREMIHRWLQAPRERAVRGLANHPWARELTPAERRGLLAFRDALARMMRDPDQGHSGRSRRSQSEP